MGALERVTEFYPLVVRLEGRELPRHEFLEGAPYWERIDGIEVGFATAFEWRWNYYRDDNWNFYGARIHESFRPFAGLLDAAKDRSALNIHARFNVLQTARVKLQLPDRRAIIQDEFFRQFVRKAHAAAYRFFQTQERHALPFKDWQEAKELGVELPEAVCLLASWHASPPGRKRRAFVWASRATGSAGRVGCAVGRTGCAGCTYARGGASVRSGIRRRALRREARICRLCLVRPAASHCGLGSVVRWGPL